MVAEAPKETRVRWICRCECGKEIEVQTSHLRSGHTQSCGCYRLDQIIKAKRTHGQSGKTKEYVTWCHLKSRCMNCKNSVFPHYGGRGIRVCDRWLNSFEAFLEDMGYAPSPKYSIDRKDNNGDYEKSNCHWATQLEQTNNQRGNIAVIYKGVQYPTLSSLARALNIYAPDLYRLHRTRKLPIDQAVAKARNSKEPIYAR